jgi:hypothetical protein
MTNATGIAPGIYRISSYNENWKLQFMMEVLGKDE